MFFNYFLLSTIIISNLFKCQCFAFVLYPKNNVCKTLKAYSTIIHDNTNCWFNPDVNSSPKLIAKRHGFNFEQHTVVTQDGYLLSLHRISGQTDNHLRKLAQPILIQHGAAGSSALMMMQGNKSLAFILANNGYDVWLLNSRESYYSTHLFMNQTQRSYWKFGINEMAIYDLPACINFIGKETGQKGNLIFIGHSLGTTTSYIYSIKKKQHAEENLKGIVSLAPVAYMKNVEGAFKVASAIVPDLSKLLQIFGLAAVTQYHEVQRSLLEITCGRYLIGTCNFFLDIFSGMAPNQLQPEILPLLFNYYPAGLSLRTINHLVQFVNSHGEFRELDFGAKTNIKYHGQREPPEYDTKLILLPVHLFVGVYDNLAGLKDSMILLEKINTNKSKKQAWIHPLPLAHMDFVVGKNLDTFYQQLLEVIQTFR